MQEKSTCSSSGQKETKSGEKDGKAKKWKSKENTSIRCSIFIRLLQKVPERNSIRKSSREMQIPRSTVHKVVCKRLHLYAYKVQIVQALKPADYDSHSDFAIEMPDCIHHDNCYLDSMMFSDESIFHLSGYVNKQNVQIWGSKKPYAVIEFT
jgi:hypothetical protein